MLRFAYATDPGLARPGWFMDDVVIKAGDTVIYSSDFETRGRRGALQRRLPRVARHRAALHDRLAATSRPTRTRRPSTRTCWRCATAPASTPTARASPTAATSTFAAGVLLAYTDEDHGYGNVGTDNPPAQTPLDARPEPGSDTPNLDDAAFKAGDAFSDGGAGHTDNYTDDNGDPWVLKYGCLSFAVTGWRARASGRRCAGAYDLAGDVKFTTTRDLRQLRLRQRRARRGRSRSSRRVTPPTQERKPTPIAATPPAVAPPAAVTTKKATACKARGARARGPLRSFRDAVPDVRRQGADGHVPAQARRTRARGPDEGAQGRAPRALAPARARPRAPTRCASTRGA